MLRPFRFGMLSEHMQSYQEWMTTVRKTEDYGYAIFLMRDHFIREPFGDQFAPLAALTTAATITKTLRVGSMVFDNDYRHPVMLAKEAATLDLLSGGRFELGIGAGWHQPEYKQADIPFDMPGVRVSRLEEALHVLKGLFAEQPFTFSGDYYKIHNLNGFPKPTQTPYPPMLIGAGSRRMLSIAAREANIIGILPKALANGTIPDDIAERSATTIEQKVSWIREAAGQRFSQIELSMVISVVITEHQQQSAEQFANQRGWSQLSVEQVLEMPSVFIGSVDQIVEKMYRRRERFGFSYYVVPDESLEEFAPVVQRLAGR